MACTLSEVTTLPIKVDGYQVERLIEPGDVRELTVATGEIAGTGQGALIVGGGTRLAFGNVGGPFDVAISTRRLTRILHYEPDDLTLAVEPGCTIAQITELLSQRGQMIALDAAFPERSTIGGAYATGMSGPRRLGGGALKDWTIGVETAGPDGVVAKAGGMVVKNVTGYDMMHVHHGALGAFGIVTRLNLKVFPLPGPPRAVVLHYATAADAHAAGIALLQSQLQPSSLLVANDDGWTLRVRCDGPASVVSGQVKRVAELASAVVAPEQVDVSDAASTAVQPFVDATNLIDNPGVARLSIPASKQLAAIRALVEAGDQRICADPGSGLIYVAGAPDEAWVRNIRVVSERAVFLALPAHLKHGQDVFGGVDPASAAIVRRLKQTFDPYGALNRGRFVLNV